MSVLDLIMQQQALQTLGKIQEQPKGLLGMSSPKQMGLLGATQGIQPYMGYTDKPVSLGQVLAGAGGGYTSGLQAGYQQDLQKSLGTLGALGTIKDIMAEPTPPGSVKVIDAKTGKPGFVPKGQELSTDEQGNPLYYPYEGGQIGYTVTTGPEGTSITPTLVGGYGEKTSIPTIEKGTKKTLEENILQSTKQFDAITRIEEKFDPAYLQYPTRVENYINSILEKTGVELSPKEKEDLEKYSSWKRESYQALNEYIKYITGAQMSEAEAQRLTKGFPDPTKDSPTQYLSKLRSLKEELLLVRARTNYFLNNKQEFLGLDANNLFDPNNSLENSLSITDMKSTIVNQYKKFKNEISQNPQYKGMSDEQFNNVAKQMTSNYFGVDFNQLIGKY